MNIVPGTVVAADALCGIWYQCPYLPGSYEFSKRIRKSVVGESFLVLSNLCECCGRYFLVLTADGKVGYIHKYNVRQP